MIKICKLAIDIGHHTPFDGGAVGIREESVLNYEVGSKLMQKCRAAGIEVIDCTPRNVKSLYDSLNQRVAAANINSADFFISIHHNASPGGAGTEISLRTLTCSNKEARGEFINEYSQAGK